MRYLILILFATAIYSQNEIIVQKTDNDSLWQTINNVYTLDEDVVIIKSVSEYGFVMRIGDSEYLCTTSTMPEYFFKAIKNRKKKFI